MKILNLITFVAVLALAGVSIWHYEYGQILRATYELGIAILMFLINSRWR